jgi:hypothetical protein
MSLNDVHPVVALLSRFVFLTLPVPIFRAPIRTGARVRGFDVLPVPRDFVVILVPRSMIGLFVCSSRFLGLSATPVFPFSLLFLGLNASPVTVVNPTGRASRLVSSRLVSSRSVSFRRFSFCLVLFRTVFFVLFPFVSPLSSRFVPISIRVPIPIRVPFLFVFVPYSLNFFFFLLLFSWCSSLAMGLDKPFRLRCSVIVVVNLSSYSLYYQLVWPSS